MNRLLKICTVVIFCTIALLTTAQPAYSAGLATERIYGMNTYQTAVQVAYKINPGIVENVVLVNGNGFADALAAVPLARQKNAPLLYVNTTPDGSGDTLSYLQYHLDRNGHIYILGGNGVISASWENTLAYMGFQPGNIHRLAGADRYATAVEVAKAIQHNGTEFFIVSGEDFPDALSASVAASLMGSLSYAEAKYLGVNSELGGVPLLLLPSYGAAPDCVVNYLNSLKLPWWINMQAFNVVGGEGAVSSYSVQDLINKLSNQGFIRTRYQGANRYATSANLNRIGYESFYVNQGIGNIIPYIYVATGESYHDALSGAVLAAINHAPLVLVDNPVPQDTQYLLEEFRSKNALAGYTKSKITVIGGKNAVSESTVYYLGQMF